MQEQITDRGRELVSTALSWLDSGIVVVPAQPRSKIVNLRWRTFENNPPSAAQVRRWFYNGVMNVAVICGTGGLLVLDFDDLDECKAFQLKAGSLGHTYAEATRRGAHLFYKVDRPVTRRFKECEALGSGHLCLVYPSVHPSGSLYLPELDFYTPIIQVKTSELFTLLSEPPERNIPVVTRESLNNSSLPAGIAKFGGNGSDLIERIKDKFPLATYASSFTELKPCGGDGRYLSGRCPFHEDKNPSLTIDTIRGLWRCYAPSCQGSAGGDVINFYALIHGIPVRDAIRRLAGEFL